MPYYHQSGKIPHKRHTQYRKADGSLYSEQLFSTERFSNDYSLLYHCHPPTSLIHTDEPYDVIPLVAEEKMLRHRSFEGFGIAPEGNFLASRKPVLISGDCHIALAAPRESMSGYFYKNADAGLTPQRADRDHRYVSPAAAYRPCRGHREQGLHHEAGRSNGRAVVR